MYTVDLYNNTGYNVENIPDSAALLGTPSISKTAVDTIQNYVMSSVRISAVFDDVKNADYCKIGDFYYFVTGVTMTSRDVAVISLIPDYITSYGLTNLKFLDGITVRHHVDDDSFGKYTEDDPLLYCNEPLVLEKSSMLFAPSSATPETIVVSTVDLSAAGDPNATKDGITYEDGQGNAVTVPHLPTNVSSANPTDFVMNDGSFSGKVFEIPSNVAYNLRVAQIRDGIQYCRDIAAETAILACYQIPSNFCSTTSGTATGELSAITGFSMVQSSTLHYTGWMAQQPRNARVLYGQFNRYGILTMSGNRTEARPEEIYDSTNPTQPRIICVTDPRPDGKPYFRFEYLNKETPVTSEQSGYISLDLSKFWFNVVPGEDWYQVPLVFTTTSGIIQQQRAYDNSYKASGAMYDIQSAQRLNPMNYLGLSANYGNSASNYSSNGLTENWSNKWGGSLGGGSGMSATPVPTVGPLLGTSHTTGGQIASGTSQSSGISFGFNPIAALGGGINSVLNQNAATTSRNIELAQSLYGLSLAKEVVVPAVMFPYTNGTIRDYAGNGVVAYRYHPSDNDVELQDKILTMYGYQVTDKMDKKYFYNRQYFNYVQATNISLGNNLPQWWKSGIVSQLIAGVRV